MTILETPFDKLRRWAWMALAAALVTGLAVQTVRLHSAQLALAAAQTEFAQAAAKQSQDLAKATAAARSAEAGLQAGADQSRNQINDQVRTLSARNASLLDRVRRAEARAPAVSGPAAAAGPGQAAGGGDGPELLGTLGEADVHEAERADVIRFHLAACYAQYDRAAAALRDLK